MGLSIFDEVAAFAFTKIFTSAAGAALVTVAPVAERVLRVDSILITSSDTVAQEVDVYRTVGGAVGLLGTVIVPVGAGTAGAPPVEFVTPLIGGPAAAIVIPVGGSLQMSVPGQVTAAKNMWMNLTGGFL